MVRFEKSVLYTELAYDVASYAGLHVGLTIFRPSIE